MADDELRISPGAAFDFVLQELRLLEQQQGHPLTGDPDLKVLQALSGGLAGCVILVDMQLERLKLMDTLDGRWRRLGYVKAVLTSTKEQLMTAGVNIESVSQALDEMGYRE